MRRRKRFCNILSQNFFSTYEVYIHQIFFISIDQSEAGAGVDRIKFQTQIHLPWIKKYLCHQNLLWICSEHHNFVKKCLKHKILVNIPAFTGWTCFYWSGTPSLSFTCSSLRIWWVIRKILSDNCHQYLRLTSCLCPVKYKLQSFFKNLIPGSVPPVVVPSSLIINYLLVVLL